MPIATPMFLADVACGMEIIALLRNGMK